MKQIRVERRAVSRLQGLLAVCMLAAAGWVGAAEQAGRYERIVPAGRVSIVASEGAWGLIDANGQPLTALRYQAIEPFGEGHEPLGFVVTSAQGQSGVLDADGRVVTDAIWAQLQPVQLWRDDPTRTRWFFEVRQGHREGVLDFSGRAVLPVHFGSLTWLGARSPMVIVAQGGKQGVCNVLTGDCPQPLSDKRFSTFSGMARSSGLLLLGSAGRFGIVDDQLREVLPPWYEGVQVLKANPDGSLVVLAQLGLDRQQFVLAADDGGRWQARKADQLGPLRARRDDHPQALRQGAVIDARYVPVEFSDSAATQQGFADKRLTELRQPSIQLSAWVAYVGFDLFARPDDVRDQPLADVWTRCPDPVGVRLVAWRGELSQQAQACASKTVTSVHLKPTSAADGSLLCDGCEPLGLPQRWLRRDEPSVDPSCAKASPPWSQAQARRDYARWAAAWLRTWQPVLQGKEPGKAASEGWRQHQADPSRAMSTLSALARRPDALLSEIGFDVNQNHQRTLADALVKWLGRAEPVGEGGLYPEPEIDFAGQCAQVWYMRWPEFDKLMRGRSMKAGQPFAQGLGLPKAGTLERQVYPFLTFSRGSDGGLQLSGVSREFLQAVWLLEGGR